MSQLRFLVTGARAPVALEWVRRLGRAGHAAAAADSFDHPLCRYSRYLGQYYRLPAARDNPVAFADAVRTKADEFGATLVIPTCEEILHLAASPAFQSGPVRLFSGPISQLILLHDKGRFAEFTRQLGHAIQAPESHVVRTREELERFANQAGDFVLKPVYSRFGCRTVVHATKEKWRSVQPSPADPWLVQRRVSGVEYCTYAIAVEGKVLAFAAYHSKYRIRNARGEPGAGIHFAPVEMPGLLDFTRRVVAELLFTGQIAFDAIVGPEQTWVLECNPRATSGLHLLQLRDPAPILAGTAGDLWTADPAPRMLASALLLAPKKWLSLLSPSRARDVIYASDDRRPLFHSMQFIREIKRRARALGVSLPEASSADFEWNGETGQMPEPVPSASPSIAA